MPVKPGALHSAGELFGLLFPQGASGQKEVNIQKNPNEDVKPVESGQRKINRVEVVGAWEVVVLKFAGVFKTLHPEK